ncbi:cell wall-associated NlpC family hydrolase [Actinocorallia herbida]|uniref:Cell wall-associated NlpC family hydrolase n=1 Tax=Actinocorallia herbida TaxID=58109 RepID=A0A3N1CR93_9ACTN|nr:C40 family peptidase [Actinocorallia herbida]ROO83836.1 cell wall-associated NlpC family hydrolase [Actinocorallia herbida]
MAVDTPKYRSLAVACLAAALVWSVPGAALAEPTQAEAQKKLDKLTEQVEQLVDKFNALNGDLKVAKRKLSSAKKAATREQKAYDDAREGVVQMAADAYKTGDISDITTLLSSGDPQDVLDQVSIFSHVTNQRGDKIKDFLASTQRMEREKGNAQDAFDKVNAKVKDIKDQKAVIDKAIDKQKDLVESLGGDTATTNGPVGGTYTGPASGPARTALDYAYKQLGKPYIYGGTGPTGYDCSGLTSKSWAAAGVAIPRTAASQYNYTASKRVSYENLQPGDLIFFSGLGHVGMYVGGGEMIHAPRTGKNVEIVTITSGYYRDRFVGGGRP